MSRVRTEDPNKKLVLSLRGFLFGVFEKFSLLHEVNNALTLPCEFDWEVHGGPRHCLLLLLVNCELEVRGLR